jgi:hypothetical protein
MERCKLRMKDIARATGSQRSVASNYKVANVSDYPSVNMLSHFLPLFNFYSIDECRS